MSFVAVTQALLDGFLKTFLIFIITLVCAVPLGLIVSFGSMTKFRPLRWLTRTFVWIIRGTPLMLQIIVVFYGPGLVFGWTGFPRMQAVLVAFVINYAAYFSEIYRSGIQSVPAGQYEAGQVLGMTRRQIFFKIILIQVIKRIVPPMSNEIITLVKDTSLARIIAIREIVMESEAIMRLEAIIWPLFYSGAFYLIFVGLLTLLFGYIERRLGYFKV
jgi:polar amino acid transport system permease protein